MSDLPLLTGVLVLLGCQLLGEVTVRLLGLEVPGPVVGMVVFFVILRVRRPSERSGLVRAPSLLLRHLQLLFVPAGVGIVVYLDTLRDDGLPLAAGLWLSWLLGLAVTGGAVAGLSALRRKDRR